MQHKRNCKYLYTVQRTMKFISICFIILTSNLVDAQIPETNPNFHSADNWVFGDSVWLKFTDTGIMESSLPLDVLAEASSSFSDSLGNLKIYTRPETIYDNLGNIINLLKGGNSSREGCWIQVANATF
jgi:hypothetical protein